MSRVSNLLPLLVVLFLAALTFWLRVSVEAPETNAPGKNRGDPDAVVENFTLTRLNAAGKANYVLNARRMLHFPGNDSTQLEAPQFSRRGDGPAIRISADRGALDHEKEEARFYGNVMVVREAGGSRRELRVSTEYLQVLARRDIIRTDRPITIREGGSVISGVGMELNRRTSTFAVFSRARGSFEPARR